MFAQLRLLRAGGTVRRLAASAPSQLVRTAPVSRMLTVRAMPAVAVGPVAKVVGSTATVSATIAALIGGTTLSGGDGWQAACAAAPIPSHADAAAIDKYSSEAATASSANDEDTAPTGGGGGVRRRGSTADDGRDPSKRRSDTNGDDGRPFTFVDACRFIWALVDRKLLLLGCLLTVAGVAMQLVVPIRSAALLKAAQHGGLTLRAVLAVLGVANLKALLTVGGAACLASAGNRLKRRLRATLFSAILAQEVGWLHAQRPPALIASITADTDAVAHAVTNSISTALGSLAKVVGSLASLTLISPQLTAAVLCLAPPAAVFAAACARYEGGMRRRKDRASTDAVVGASEIVEKLPTVQVYAQERREEARYEALLSAHGALERALFVFHRAWTTVMQLVVQSATALSLALAGHLAHQGRFDPAMLLPFSQLAMNIGQGVGALTYLSGDAAKVREAVRRLKELAERRPSIAGDAGEAPSEDSPFFRGRMALRGVTFAYPSRPHTKVLDNCTIELEPGKTTALVGPSGGGKSTVQLLLARFYDPEGGRVELDGADLTVLQPRWLRARVVGAVTQEPVLLPGTIRENIAYARPDATDEEVVAAATAANAHGFISALADGYETQLGYGGASGASEDGSGGGHASGGGGGHERRRRRRRRRRGSLSVGQKQRLAIARALLKDPKVLLLDEPTSALDPASEAAVQQALDRLSAGRTTLVVAHRLATVKHADAICVLVGGRVVERGTHDELLAAGGEYARMVASQSLAASGGGGRSGR